MRQDYRQREIDGLLGDFDRTAGLVLPFAADKLGAEEAEALRREARAGYAEIIPRVPRTATLRGRIFDRFLRITAQEVALYQALKARGGTPAEAWEICHEAIRLRMREVPEWKRRFSRRLMFSGLTKAIVKRREQKGERLRFGNFEVRYLSGDGREFDFGVDYVSCGNLQLVRELGADEFAPYVCMSDIALGDALGWGLIRTQTLADGCSHCDFRFKKDARTRISSKTPEVQRVVEEIAKRAVTPAD